MDGRDFRSARKWCSEGAVIVRDAVAPTPIENAMIRATSVLRRAAVKADRIADTLALDHEARAQARAELKAEGGLEFLLDLDRATALDDGDAVKLEDGRLVQIKAAPERLIEVTTGNPARLARVAWHLGSRHVPAEFGEGAIHVPYAAAALEMIRGLGASAQEVTRPFRPERGHEGHDHHHHEHGPDCGCGHDHDHHAHSHSNSHSHGHSQGHHVDHDHHGHEAPHKHG